MKNLFRSLFIIASGFCYAQHFDAGITGGLSMSQVSGDQYAGYNQVWKLTDGADIRQDIYTNDL